MDEILVYDNKNYIYRIVKSYFKNDDIEVIKSTKEYLSKPKIQSFKFIIFVFYDEFDIIDFIDYFLINKKIIILYDDINHVEKIFESNTNFQTINLNLQKKEILKIIKEILISG